VKRKPLPLVTNCNDCGVCCLHMRTPPHIVYLIDGELQPNGDDNYGDFARLMAAPEEARRVLIEGLHGDRPDESPCSWFDPESKKCRWHEFRPDVCRGFEVGSESCLTARKRHRVGMSNGKYRLVGGKLMRS
jgi:Fe-S-cluster containining protein